MNGIVLAGFSALAYGLADFAGGFAARKSRLLAVLGSSQTAGAVLALIAILVLRQPFPPLRDIAWSALAGMAGLVGLFALYRGIAKSVVAVVSPLSALIAAALPLIFGLLRGERPSTPALVGAGLCLPAVFLLSWEGSAGLKNTKLHSAILHGLTAGIGFGCFFIALALTSPGSGLWPVFTARLASLVIVFSVLLFNRGERALDPAGLPWILAAGLSDMGANILFLFATRSGLLSLVSVVSSLFPAPTVLLARIIFKESLPPLRVVGLGLALAGVALMSLV